MAAASNQKQRAIDIHHEQADLFRRRYEELEEDPYCSAFTYGRRKVDAVLDRYLPNPGKGRRLLDAGCGSGYTLMKMAERGYACAGLDAAEGMVAHARELNPGMDIRTGDVEQLPFGDAAFDRLLNIEVIRYLADPRKAIREFHRVLAPGGIALVTAMPPYTLTGYAFANILTSKVQIGRYSKVRQYFHTVEVLEQMFKECGFEKVEVKAVFWGPWRNVEPLLGGSIRTLLRRWEPIDDKLTHFPALRDCSNHLIVAATK